MKYLSGFYELTNENTSATGGPVSGGMGAVVSAQPSGLAGQTIGQNWASGGGVEGSGDIAVPYNPSGVNRVFQKIPAQMGKGHGPMTGKKSRKKKLDLKALKAAFDKRSEIGKSSDETGIKKSDKKSNIMNFSDFSSRKDITRVKHLSQ